MGSSVCMKTARWLKDTVRGILLPRKPEKKSYLFEDFWSWGGGMGMGGGLIV